MLAWTPIACPTCGEELPGLGRYCEVCHAYVEDMGAATDATPEARARIVGEIPDHRLRQSAPCT